MRSASDRSHPHRWHPDVYNSQNLPTFIHFSTKNRNPWLVPDIAPLFIEVLLNRAPEDGMDVFLYCVMPDHVHLGCRPAAEMPRFEVFIRQVKSESSRLARKRWYPDFAWQRSFWDTQEMTVPKVNTRVKYILENPVRKGLCSRWDEWPWAWAADAYL